MGDKLLQVTDFIRDNFANDQVMEYLTHPYGMATLAVLIVLAIFFKQKLIYVSCTVILAGILMMNYLLDGTESQGYTMVVFLVCTVGIVGFVLYNTLVRDD